MRLDDGLWNDGDTLGRVEDRLGAAQAVRAARDDDAEPSTFTLSCRPVTTISGISLTTAGVLAGAGGATLWASEAAGNINALTRATVAPSARPEPLRKVGGVARRELGGTDRDPVEGMPGLGAGGFEWGWLSRGGNWSLIRPTN
ncbi:MAG: hypothetical protein V4710_02470 [Verrucomicrobiota bacterium]